jgi:DNA-binding NarL/FixJ family response regulator
MKRRHVLKVLVTGGADGIFLQIGDETILAETAVKIWEALEVDVGNDQKLPAPEKKAQKEKTAPKKKPLDDGKILALRKAGWSLAKIADEMGCSAQTIVNHIEAMTKAERTADVHKG